MRNLLLFIIRFNYVFAFLLLEIVSIAFVVNSHSYHRVGFLNSAGIVTGSIYNTYYGFSEYLGLGDMNKRLMDENAQLWMKAYRVRDTLPPVQLADSCEMLQYEFIPAKAINYTTNRSTNYITLDKGKNAGIAKDMGVVTDHGIVGIVNHVSANFANVMSVLHKDSRISIKVKKFNYPGTLQWDGGPPSIAEIIGIPMHLPVAVGDSIATSGFSAIFPENIPVGTIAELTLPKGSSFFRVKVKLSANLETLQYAYVVNNLLQKEQRELEGLNND